MRPAALPWDVNPTPPIDRVTRWRIALERAIRWEFWPAWLFYLPIIVWILLLALRYRSLTVFTAANPAIETGGFVGENKHRILEPLQENVPELLASFVLVPESNFDHRYSIIEAFVEQTAFPVVLKPNIGGRGRGVMIARNTSDLSHYLKRCTGEIIAQKYIEGEEFGIFIARHPSTQALQILSIAHKTFPQLIADGQHTLRELIVQDARAKLITDFLFKRWAQELNTIPTAGLTIPLVEIGAHCRGSVFLDAQHLDSSALRATLTHLLDATPGYAFGRIDLRAPSAEALQQGLGLKVIELNGVTSESAHIYQPGYPISKGYRAMLHQWSIAFAIGHAYAQRGAHISTLPELLRQWRADMRRGEQWF